jgi:hypothetical protein
MSLGPHSGGQQPSGDGQQSYPPRPPSAAQQSYPLQPPGKKRTRPRTIVLLALGGGFVIGSSSLSLWLGAHARTDRPIQLPATVATIASPAPRPKPHLAPEPTAKLAAKSGEVPAIQAKLDADRVYQDIWTGSRDRLDDFLTTVAMLLCMEDNFAQAEVEKIKAHKVGDGDAAFKLEEIMLRTGSYPTTFMANLKDRLTRLGSQPHLGVWAVGASSDGGRNYDYSALAAWVYRDDPAYFREMISARDHGKNMAWLPRPDEDSAMPVTRPYLVFELDAYEWLSQFGPLTASERSRVAKVAAEAQVKRVDLSTMLNDYGQNELRADDKYKGKVVRFTAIADAPKRGTVGGINVRLSTSNAFQHPAVTCYFEEDQTQSVSAISKGDRVNVRGQVEGLMGDVALRRCEFED